MAWTGTSLVAACIALVFCAALAHGQLNPYEPGPLVTGQVSVSPIGIGAPDHRLAIFYPKLPGGYPVILFWSGFAGVTPGDFYSGVFSKIASHGIIVASVFAPEAPDYEKHPNTTLELIDYLLTDRVSKAIEEDGTPGVYLNTSTQLVLMGHSAGGHVICNYVKKGCAQSAVPKAMVFWDPVDGFRSPCSDDGEVVKFNIPTLIIGSDYFLNLCAPENLGYHRFEAAWNCPRWSVAVKNFGHVDMLDAVARIPGAVVCGGNLLATPAQFDANQHLWAGASIAMTKLSAQNQCEYLKYVENAGDHAPDKAGPVTTSNDVPCLGGVGACPKGSCNDLSKSHPF